MSRSSNGNICGMIDNPLHRGHSVNNLQDQSPTSILYNSSSVPTNLFSPPGQYSPVDTRVPLPGLSAQRIRTSNLGGRGAISINPAPANLRLPPLPPISPHHDPGIQQLLLRQQLQQHQSGSQTPTRSYDGYGSQQHNPQLEPTGVFNNYDFPVNGPPGRHSLSNSGGSMPDGSNFGIASWHGGSAQAGSPMMCTPPRSPQIMSYTSPRGLSQQQQHYHERPNSSMSSHSGGSGMGGAPAVYDMKSLTSAISMVPSGTGDIRRIFQSATFGPRLPGLTKLVSQLTREGHWSKGLEVFDSLDVIGLRPDTTITNAAISACDKGGQWEKGMQIFTHMAEWGLSRDAITYSAAISALSKGRQWSLAIDVFNHMCDCGVDCDAVTCCSLITALDKGGQWQLAEQVFMQMYAEHPQFKVLLQCMGEEPGVVAPGSIMTMPTTVAQLMSTDSSGRMEGGMNLAVGGNTSTVLGGAADPNGPSRATQNALAAAAAYAAASAAASDPSSSATGSGSPWYGPPASPAGNPLIASHASLDIAQLKGLTLVEGDEVIEKVKGQWLPAQGSGPSQQSGSGIASGLGSGMTRGADPPAGMEAWSNVGPEGPVKGLAGDGEAGGEKGLAGGQLQALQRLQQQLQLADAAAANAAASAGGSVHGGGGVLPLIRSPSMSGPNAGRDPAEVLMSQASLGGMLGPSGGSRSMWPGGGCDSPASFLMMDPQQQQQMGGGSMGSVMPGFMGPGSMSPGSLGRTTSCPPYQRGLLRTSSLNNKKSAPNRVCCNALLAVYARASPTQWQRAIRLLELMWQCGGELCPDIVSYNTVIKACGNAMQIDLGFKVYHVMRKRGIEPTVATYGTLVCIASDAQHTSKVKEAWGWLRASGLEVHVTCVNAYLGALIKEDDWDDAERLFGGLMRPGGPAKPNAVTFNLMMNAYLAKERPERVQQLFEDMYTHGVQPSVNTYTTLIAAYVQRQQWGDAVNVLGYMCRPENNVRPAIGTVTGLFSAMHDAVVAAPAEARILLRWMHAVRGILKSHSHLHPDVSTYRAMITAFQSVGECDVVLELFNLMLAHSLPIDAESAQAVLQAVCARKSWDKVVQLLKVLQEHGPQVPASTIANVIQYMAEESAWIHVYCVVKVCSSWSEGSLDELIVLLKEGGATELLFIALLVSKERCGAWQEALEMFEWMQRVQQTALSSSKDMYRIMFELLVVHGAAPGLKQAVLLCKKAHEMGHLASFLPLKIPGPAAEGSSSDLTPAGSLNTVGQGQFHGMPGGDGQQQQLLMRHIVALEGYSRIETVVTLLAWALMVQEAAKQGVRIQQAFVDIITLCSGDVLDVQHIQPAMAMVLDGSFCRMMMAQPTPMPQTATAATGGSPPPTGMSPSPTTVAVDSAASSSSGATSIGVDGGAATTPVGSSDVAAVGDDKTTVLESVAAVPGEEVVSGAAVAPVLPDTDISVLKRPVAYFLDEHDSALVHVQTESLYASMGL